MVMLQTDSIVKKEKKKQYSLYTDTFINSS